MDFTINSAFDEAANCWNVEISGEVDIFMSNEFKEALLKLIYEKKADIRLECQDLGYIDSTGLGALVTVLKRVRDYSGSMSLVNVKPNIRKLFKITSLDKVFVIEGDDADA